MGLLIFGNAIGMLPLKALVVPLYALAPTALIMGFIAAAKELASPVHARSRPP